MFSMLGLDGRNELLTFGEVNALVKSDDIDLFAIADQLISEKIDHIDQTFRMQHVDGHWIWLRVRCEKTRSATDSSVHLIGIAVDIVAAAKGDDTAKFEAANKKWYANMDDISALLSSANPRSWPLAQLQPMMRMHLDLTLAEASARLHGDWAADVSAYEQVHVHILQLADELTNGIVTQFPEKFSD